MTEINGQYFARYEMWEDYQSGMWAKNISFEEERMIEDAMQLLCSDRFSVACESVFEQWQVATKINLTNAQQNRRAWLGQAACCLLLGVPEDITRAAWGKMTETQRMNANRIAETKIQKWINQNKNHGQKVFEFECF